MNNGKKFTDSSFRTTVLQQFRCTTHTETKGFFTNSSVRFLFLHRSSSLYQVLAHKHIFLHLCSRVITYLFPSSFFLFSLLSCQFILRLFSQSFNPIPLSRIENGIEPEVEVFKLKRANKLGDRRVKSMRCIENKSPELDFNYACSLIMCVQDGTSKRPDRQIRIESRTELNKRNQNAHECIHIFFYFFFFSKKENK